MIKTVMNMKKYPNLTKFKVELPYVACTTMKEINKTFSSPLAFTGFADRRRLKAMLHGRSDIVFALTGGEE